YFLVVARIVGHARELDIPVVGRGSGAGSIVAYLLGITSVDPLRFNIPFERFLNPGRKDLPDLDIDFCWRLRDEVIDNVYKTYGTEHVAMISTHNTFRRRSAFREIAKVFGIANNVISRIAGTLLDNYEEGRLPADLEDVPVDEETLRTIMRLARKVDGFPHHLSIHCGGIVISDKTIDSYVPLEVAAKGIAITQYEMEAIEDIGLVKIDLLGNRGLSAIREAVQIVGKQEGIKLRPEKFPDGDAETMELIQSGRTLACCQLESPAMRHLLVMLKPESVHRIVQALALIRPAPASIGMKEAFVRRARGLEPPRFAHPSLREVLGDTYGIMLYEDDAMLVASTLAGLSLEEGDRLRKAIKKSRTKEKLLEVSRYFLKRAARNGIPPEAAKDIWIQMAKFTEYSFCRAHAAGYGLVAYQAAYLKAHHPAGYMVAAINNLQGIYPTRVHVWEAKRMGIEVLPPCVNHSEAEFSLVDGRIRMGVAQVKGLSTQTMEAILKQRAKAPFRDVRDFMVRVRPGLGEVESLVLVGGFDASYVVSGFNFSFGHKGAGNTALLREMGDQLGFITNGIEEVLDDEGEIISSTRIRQYLADAKPN
ncbi:MAG: DNA polymerase III subunit alpha, partial [Phycisphaerae bacterium]|nr:DNA polymerase III subunit alpha [Phycisphaerae bacterium]